MNILIVGASGAAGIAIQKELADRGHRLRCVDVVPPRYDMAALLDLFGYEPVIPQVDWVYDDILRDGVAEAIVKDMDVCVYCALPRPPWKNEATEQFPVNLIGPSELAQKGAMVGLRRFVYASSVSVNLSVMYPNKKTLTEDDPPLAGSSYSLSKWLAEQMLRCYARAHGLRSVCLRLGTIRPHWYLWGPGHSTDYKWRQFYVDIRDVARAFRLAVENETIQFDVFNIVSNGEPERCSPARAKAVLGFEAQYNGPDHFKELHRKQLEFLQQHKSQTPK